VLRLQYCSESVVLGWKLKVVVRGFRICNCLVDWICVGDKVLVNNNGFFRCTVRWVERVVLGLKVR
jgi:hypothetical protein